MTEDAGERAVATASSSSSSAKEEEEEDDTNWAGVIECTVEMPRCGVAAASPWDGPLFKARWVGRAGVHRSGKDW